MGAVLEAETVNGPEVMKDADAKRAEAMDLVDGRSPADDPVDVGGHPYRLPSVDGVAVHKHLTDPIDSNVRPGRDLFEGSENLKRFPSVDAVVNGGYPKDPIDSSRTYRRLDRFPSVDGVGIERTSPLPDDYITSSEACDDT